jgi:hypothetical protein
MDDLVGWIGRHWQRRAIPNREGWAQMAVEHAFGAVLGLTIAVFAIRWIRR